jgi:plastocyanin
MIWRSATCFSLLLSFLPLASKLAAATVSGTVVLADPGAHDRDFSGVVVHLQPVSGRVDTIPMHVRMLQKNKTFVPHLLVVTVGSTIDFPNADPIFHNAFSNFNGQVFDVGLYPPGKSRAVVFRSEGVVRVFCNIHPTMSALIVVLDTPYFALTDRDGHYQIPNVPRGNYKRVAFYERATPEVLAAAAHEFELADANLVLPPLTISEAGYLPAPHANKFGKPYPHGAGEAGYSVPQ